MAGVLEVVGGIASAANSISSLGKTATSGAGSNAEKKDITLPKAQFNPDDPMMQAFAQLGLGQDAPSSFGAPTQYGLGSPSKLGVDFGSLTAQPQQDLSVPAVNSPLLDPTKDAALTTQIESQAVPTDYAPYLQGAATLGGLAGTVAQLAKKGPRASSSPISLNQPQFPGGGDLISMLSRLSQMGK